MEYGEEFSMFGLSWAMIHFVENPGMAFGLSFGGDYGKLLLSLFRICAAFFLIYYIRLLIKTGAPKGILVCISLIFAGAVGNIIDSAIYGVIFSSSSYHGGLATLFPAGGGYAGFLHGNVVDMLYFPMFDFIMPKWVPYFGGQSMQFFKPVFNIADSAITVGAFSLLLFNRHFFSTSDEKTETTTTSEIAND